MVTDAGVSRRSAAGAPDPKTGNQALHIAVQNGHRQLTQLLVAWKADVTVQNFKGQTPLHMSVEYDFHFISKLLLEKGAKPEVENADGCKAILGISGSKEGAEDGNVANNTTRECMSAGVCWLHVAIPGAWAYAGSAVLSRPSSRSECSMSCRAQCSDSDFTLTVICFQLTMARTKLASICIVLAVCTALRNLAFLAPAPQTQLRGSATEPFDVAASAAVPILLTPAAATAADGEGMPSVVLGVGVLCALAAFSVVSSVISATFDLQDTGRSTQKATARNDVGSLRFAVDTRGGCASRPVLALHYRERPSRADTAAGCVEGRCAALVIQRMPHQSVTVISKLLLGKGAKPEAGDAAGSLQNVLAVHLAAVRLRTRMEVELAYKALEAKELPGTWNMGRFVELLNKAYCNSHHGSRSECSMSCDFTLARLFKIEVNGEPQGRRKGPTLTVFHFASSRFFFDAATSSSGWQTPLFLGFQLTMARTKLASICIVLAVCTALRNLAFLAPAPQTQLRGSATESFDVAASAAVPILLTPAAATAADGEGMPSVVLGVGVLCALAAFSVVSSVISATPVSLTYKIPAAALRKPRLGTMWAACALQWTREGDVQAVRCWLFTIARGHRELTQLLVAWKAVTVISKLLLEKGAKPEAGDAAGSLQNVLAVHLAAVRLRTRMEVELAYKALEEDPTSLDKASLARVGMLKAKELPGTWNMGRFVELLNKAYCNSHHGSRSECSMSCDFTLARLFKIEVNGEPQGRRKGPTLTVFHFASSRFFFDAATSSSGWQTPLFLGFQLTMARTKLASICIVLAVCTALRNLAFLAPAPQTQLRGSATEPFDVAASAAVPILLTPAAATAADGEGMPSVVLGVGVLCALAAFSVVSSVISATFDLQDTGRSTQKATARNDVGSLRFAVDTRGGCASRPVLALHYRERPSRADTAAGCVEGRCAALVIQRMPHQSVTVISKLLLEKGAKPEAGDAAGSLQNVLAVHLAAVRLRTRMEVELAYKALEDPTSLDKASLARVGMLKAKELPGTWNMGRFVELLNKAYCNSHHGSRSECSMSCDFTLARLFKIEVNGEPQGRRKGPTLTVFHFASSRFFFDAATSSSGWQTPLFLGFQLTMARTKLASICIVLAVCTALRNLAFLAPAPQTQLRGSATEPFDVAASAAVPILLTPAAATAADGEGMPSVVLGVGVLCALAAFSVVSSVISATVAVISKLLLEKGAKPEAGDATGSLQNVLAAHLAAVRRPEVGSVLYSAVPVGLVLEYLEWLQEVELAYKALEVLPKPSHVLSKHLRDWFMEIGLIDGRCCMSVEDPTSLDKASLARVGMLKAKELPGTWNMGRFVELLNKAYCNSHHGFQLTMARTKLASICIVLAVCTALRNLAFLAPAPQTQLRGSATESFDVAASAAVPILLTPAAATAADGEGMPSVVLGVGILCMLAAFSAVSSVISATDTRCSTQKAMAQNDMGSLRFAVDTRGGCASRPVVALHYRERPSRADTAAGCVEGRCAALVTQRMPHQSVAVISKLLLEKGAKPEAGDAAGSLQNVLAAHLAAVRRPEVGSVLYSAVPVGLVLEYLEWLQEVELAYKALEGFEEVTTRSSMVFHAHVAWCPVVQGFQLTMARTKLASICIVLAVCTALRNLAFIAPAPQTQLRGSATESFDVAASAAVPILLTPAAATAADGEGMPSVVLGVGILCMLAAFSAVSSVISATVTSELD
ncbi:ACBD6 [Symbiodinium natans]|uniref:ACBD6 protein n=1 Tax=Symbiodinium natans TaxID=878477 RepID=A0A812N7M3_9DINO|nr:ACBD6 [Symbiodinium natans]